MTDCSKTVISTRVRLARNVEGYPFPSHLKSEKQAKEIIRLVSAGLLRLDEFKLIYMDKITEAEAASLMENHLISPNLIRNRRFSAALINSDRNVSVMINEEDHLREQSIVKGLDLRLAYETMSKIDNSISGTMKFAFDEQLGYLTACPTNLGTGLRASVMFFLPAMTINGVMPEIIRRVAQLGLTVRGIYGEGSNAEGYLYQISNEVTLGVTEDSILEEVDNLARRVCKIEEIEREKLKTGAKALEIKDECLRSYGIITNCAKMDSGEFVRLASNVKLGACLGYFNIDDVSKIDEIIVKMRPANINTAAGMELTATERDIYRAQYASKHFKRLIES